MSCYNITIRSLCPTIGGLFHEIIEGEFDLSKLVEKFGADQVWDCIERALTGMNFKDLQGRTILHRAKYSIICQSNTHEIS